MKPIIRRQYQQFCECMSLTTLHQECQHQDWRREVAALELVDRLVDIYVDWLLGYHESGWAPISAMFASVMPGGGSGDEDPIEAATRKCRTTTSAVDDALYYVGQLKPRTQIALLIDSYSQRGHQGKNRLTRERVCQPDTWKRLATELSLVRIFHQQPGLFDPMSRKTLNNQVCKGKQMLARVIIENELQAA